MPEGCADASLTVLAPSCSNDTKKESQPLGATRGWAAKRVHAQPVHAATSRLARGAEASKTLRVGPSPGGSYSASDIVFNR